MDSRSSNWCLILTKWLNSHRNGEGISSPTSPCLRRSEPLWRRLVGRLGQLCSKVHKPRALRSVSRFRAIVSLWGYQPLVHAYSHEAEAGRLLVRELGILGGLLLLVSLKWDSQASVKSLLHRLSCSLTALADSERQITSGSTLSLHRGAHAARACAYLRARRRARTLKKLVRDPQKKKFSLACLGLGPSRDTARARTLPRIPARVCVRLHDARMSARAYSLARRAHVGRACNAHVRA